MNQGEENDRELRAAQEDLRKQFLLMRADAMADPIVAEFLARIRGRDEYIRASAIDVLATQRIMSIGLVGAAADGRLVLEGNDLPTAFAKLPERIASARPYLWTEHALDIALASEFRADPERELMLSVGDDDRLWIVEKPFAFNGDGDWDAILAFGDVDRCGHDVFVAMLIGSDRVRHLFTIHKNALGKAAAEIPIVRSVVTLQAFLESPYVPKKALTLDRGLRKRRGRMGLAETPGVHLIDLRAVASSEREPSGEAGRYRHRWIVRGHVRAQWYASSGEHRAIYVPPHLKGPSNAPMLETAYRVKR